MFKTPKPSDRIKVDSILYAGDRNAIEVWKPNEQLGNENPLIAFTFGESLPSVYSIQDTESIIASLQEAVDIAKGLLK